MKHFRLVPFVAISLTIVAALSVIFLLQSSHNVVGLKKTLVVEGAASGKASIGGDFDLIDTEGNHVTHQDFSQKWLLVYFGFSYCPDICPTGLEAMGDALEQLGADADKIQAVFITIDPERDTQEQMASYMSHFSPRIKGLTGDKSQIEAVAKAYRVYYAKANHPGAPSEHYLMDHSAFIYLMDPSGEFVTHFAHGTSAQKMVEILREYVK